MATVTSSTITADRAQAGGRRSVIERHAIDDGRAVLVEYLADADTNADAKLAARASAVTAQLDAEATQTTTRQDLRSGMRKLRDYLRAQSGPNLKTQLGLTDAELVALRAFYAEATD